MTQAGELEDSWYQSSDVTLGIFQSDKDFLDILRPPRLVELSPCLTAVNLKTWLKVLHKYRLNAKARVVELTKEREIAVKRQDEKLNEVKNDSPVAKEWRKLYEKNRKNLVTVRDELEQMKNGIRTFTKSQFLQKLMELKRKADALNAKNERERLVRKLEGSDTEQKVVAGKDIKNMLHRVAEAKSKAARDADLRRLAEESFTDMDRASRESLVPDQAVIAMSPERKLEWLNNRTATLDKMILNDELYFPSLLTQVIPEVRPYFDKVQGLENEIRRYNREILIIEDAYKQGRSKFRLYRKDCRKAEKDGETPGYKELLESVSEVKTGKVKTSIKKNNKEHVELKPRLPGGVRSGPATEWQNPILPGTVMDSEIRPQVPKQPIPSYDDVLVAAEKETETGSGEESRETTGKLDKELSKKKGKEGAERSVSPDHTSVDQNDIVVSGKSTDDVPKEKITQQNNKSVSFNPPGCLHASDDNLNAGFKKLVEQAAEQQKKGPQFVDVEDGQIDAEVALESAKQPVVLPTSTITSDHRRSGSNNFGAAEPLIPHGPDSSIEPVPPVSTVNIPDEPELKTPETVEKATSLNLRLITQPAKSVLQLGETVKILACVDSSSSDLLFTLPLEYTWQGHDSADGGVASVTSDEPGIKTISVLVTGKGKKGASAKAVLSLKFGKVDVIVTEYPSGPITIGQDVPLNAKVQVESKKGGNVSYLYQWQPHPEVKFKPFETADGGTTANFDSPGTYKVWVELYQKSSSGTKKIAESKQVEIKVQGIDVTLSSNPASPMIGQEVTVKAEIKQKIDPKLVRSVWESKGNIKKGSPSADGQSYSFIPVDTQPVSISLRALAKEGDLQELANESTTVTAQKYKVSISQPRRRGPPPRIWDPQVRGIVEQPQGIAVFQDADVHSTLSPKPPGKLSYHWSASPDGCTISNPFSASTQLNAHEKNTYQLLVKVTDKNNIVLGKGTGTFTVSISQRDLDVAKQKAADQKKSQELLKKGRELWKQGKLQQAITQVVNAQRIIGKDEEIAKTLRGMEKQKKQFDAKLQQAVDLIQQDKFDEAGKVLSAAATINDKYLKYQQVLQQLADAKNKWISQLLNKANNSWDTGNLEEAISILKNGSKQISDNNKIINPLKIIVKQKENIDAKLKQTVNLIRQGKLDEAENTLSGAASISDKYSKYKQTLQQLVEAQKEEAAKQKLKKKAADLLQQAKVKWSKKEWGAAISLAEDSIKAHPDNMEADRLLQKWQQERVAFEQKRAGFVKEGNVAEHQKDLIQTISSFQQAQQIRREQTLADHIELLKKQQQNQNRADKKFNSLLENAKSTASDKDFIPALTLIKKALSIKPEHAEALKLQKSWQQQLHDKEQNDKFDKLIADGYHQEQKNELSSAIQSYSEALKIRSDKRIADHIEELRKLLLKRGQEHRGKSQKAELKDKFDKLIAKGYRHEQNDELSSAIQVYTKALGIHPDRKISNHIKTLRKQVLDKENKRRQESQDALARQAHKESADRLRQIEQQKQQRQARKSNKKQVPTLWTGTFRGTNNFEDGSITLTFRLTQNGNQIRGDGSMRAQIFGEDDTASLSLQGSSNGRSATIQMSGAEAPVTLSVQLSSSGDRLSMNLGGMPFTLYRL